MSEVPTSRPKGRRRQARRIFRGCRIVILLGLLSILGAGIYFNEVGLPEFAKSRLLGRLHASGIDVQFTRLRLRWYRGLVFENVTFRGTNGPAAPQMSSPEVELDLDVASLSQRRLKVNSVSIQNGTLSIPAGSNDPPWVVRHITTEVGLPGTNALEVRRFAAAYENTRLSLAGGLTNLSALRQWEIFQKKPRDPNRPRRDLQTLALFRQMRFSGTPELKVKISGDAADPAGLEGELHWNFGAAETPWGHFEALELATRYNERGGGEPHFDFNLSAATALTPWATGQTVRARGRITPRGQNFSIDTFLSTAELHTQWVDMTNADFTGRAALSVTNPLPVSTGGTLTFDGAVTQWGSAGRGKVEWAAEPSAKRLATNDTWGFWSRLEPFALRWDAQLAGVESPKLRLASLRCGGDWTAPTLRITNCQAALYGGTFGADAVVDILTREARAHTRFDFDVQQIQPLLTPAGRRWISQYSWEKPPQVEGEGRVTLPAWTNRAPDWKGEVQPTLEIHGHFLVGPAAFRGVGAMSAESVFTYTNMNWFLPHLHAVRPEGTVEFEFLNNDRTKDYRFRLLSTIDPFIVRPLLGTNEQRGLDYFKLTGTPEIRAEIQGRWQDQSRLGLDAEIAATNLTFRGEQIDRVRSAILLTNEFLRFSGIEIEHGGGTVKSPLCEINLATRQIFFTNVYGNIDPMAVARCIGAKTVEALAPYHFHEPPTVLLNGTLVIRDIEEADMHFYVEAKKFEWWKFHADEVKGNIDWMGETLVLTNMTSKAYESGRLSGWGKFDFDRDLGTDMTFDLGFNEVDLHSLLKGLSEGRTNRLEGILQGQVVVSSANTHDWNTVQGFGHASLSDGLIWEIPVFGMFSGVLNAINPGLGTSRAREATSTFIMTNGVVRTEDLEIRATGFRMQYNGTIDLDGNLDAKMSAELFRDTWVIGRLLSLALTPLTKLFEYKVSGTIGRPKSEPHYIPKWMMAIVRPFHTLKEITPEKPPEPDAKKE